MKPSNSLLDRLRVRFARPRTGGSAAEDSFFFPGNESLSRRDRFPADYRDLIERGLRAWREDPLARRIVSLTTQFCVGRGFRFQAEDPEADAFLHAFWENPLNRMDMRLAEWSDELCRSGNLFVMLSSDFSGMSYVRAIPAGQIDEIVSMENDIEQPLFFRLREVPGGEGLRVPEMRLVFPDSLLSPCREERLLHFTVNRPVGGQWGEPDLAPILIWLDRYRVWLEDRMRLNHYRSSFLFTVKAPHYSETMRRERQRQLNAQPPTAGMILVTGADEDWQVVAPQLESSDANEDGLAIKKVIAAGAGIPLGFLAETGGSSRAETGGIEDSACRSFRQRQQLLMWITETILRHVLARAGLPLCEIHVVGEEIVSPGMAEGGIVRGI